MSVFFADCLAIADLGTGTSERRSLPCGTSEAEAVPLAARLAEHFPDALIFAVGPLTGTLAPAACLLTVRLPGATLPLTGHGGMALRRCGLDALVVTGRASAPQGLRVDERGLAFFPLDAEKTVPEMRAAMLRQSAARDSDPALLLAGPAAFAQSPAACVCLETGLVSHSTPLAAALAARNLAGISLDGALPFASPVPPLNPAAQKVRAEGMTRSSLLAICKAARKGYSGATPPAPGRPLACFGCPCPCGFWLPLPSRKEKTHVACTSPAGLAALLEAGADQDRIAALFALCDRFGLDPARMVGLARSEALPESLQDCLALTAKSNANNQGAGEAKHVFTPASPREELGLALGVCPFFLKRQPRLEEADLLACLAAGGAPQNSQTSTEALPDSYPA